MLLTSAEKQDIQILQGLYQRLLGFGMPPIPHLEYSASLADTWYYRQRPIDPVAVYAMVVRHATVTWRMTGTDRHPRREIHLTDSGFHCKAYPPVDARVQTVCVYQMLSPLTTFLSACAGGHIFTCSPYVDALLLEVDDPDEDDLLGGSSSEDDEDDDNPAAYYDKNLCAPGEEGFINQYMLDKIGDDDD